MEICTIILMSSYPIAWIAVGCFLLILLLVVTVLLVLKSREVVALKKQCEDLNETMRMMRYEEANLSRMLHTASKSMGMEQPLASATEAKDLGKDDLAEEVGELGSVIEDEEAMLLQDTIAPEEDATLEDATEMESVSESVSESQIVEITEVVPMHETVSTETLVQEEQLEVRTEELSGEHLKELGEEFVEETVVSQPRKQAINERRPAIPTDLFAAWFAENEESSHEESEVDDLEKVEECETVMPENVEATVLLTQGETPEEAVGENAKVITDTPSVAFDAPAQELLPEPSVGAVVAPQEEVSVAENSESDSSTELSKEDERFCRKLERIVNARLRNPNLNIDIIAAQFGIGRTNFYRKVRELMGTSPNDYLRKCRMERAAELLNNSESTVSEVCVQVGIPDAQYFSRVFKAYFGVSPSIYREQHNQ